MKLVQLLTLLFYKMVLKYVLKIVPLFVLLIKDKGKDLQNKQLVVKYGKRSSLNLILLTEIY